jgi:hypothetical protein
MNLRQLTNKIRALHLLLRNDPEAVAALRTLFLAICVCLVLVYTGTTLLLTPKNEKLKKMLAEKYSLQFSHPGLMDDTLIKKYNTLEKRILGLSESIAEAQLKEKLLRMQWEAMGDPKLFNKTILTLNDDAPVKMEQSLKKIDTLEPRSRGIFTIYPVLIEGEAPFDKLFIYLHYLESRPEVAFMDSLILSSDEFEENIRFSLVAGRMHLMESKEEL